MFSENQWIFEGAFYGSDIFLNLVDDIMLFLVNVTSSKASSIHH